MKPPSTKSLCNFIIVQDILVMSIKCYSSPRNNGVKILKGVGIAYIFLSATIESGFKHSSSHGWKQPSQISCIGINIKAVS